MRDKRQRIARQQARIIDLIRDGIARVFAQQKPHTIEFKDMTVLITPKVTDAASNTSAK